MPYVLKCNSRASVARTRAALPKIPRLYLDPLGRLAGNDPRAEPQVRNVDVARRLPERLFGQVARIRPAAILGAVGARELEEAGLAAPLADAGEQGGKVVEPLGDDMDDVALASA